MQQALASELKQAQQIAQTAQVFAITALVIIVITIVVKGGASIGSYLFDDTLGWRERVNEIGIILISLLPAILSYNAVNSLREALVRYSRGEFFSADASSCVAKAGFYATEAMIAMILIVPNLTLWVTHGGGFDIRFEPAYLGMLTFALFVSVVGRILSAAAQLKAENEAFI